MLLMTRAQPSLVKRSRRVNGMIQTLAGKMGG